MKPSLAIGVCCCLLIFSQPLKALEKSKQQLAHELMLRSGLVEQTNHFPKLIETGFLQGYEQVRDAGQALPVTSIKKIRQVLLGSFEPKIIQDFCLRQIQSDLSRQEIEAVLGWLDSPLGRKITELEEISSTPEAYNLMVSQSENLLREAAASQRLPLYARLDKAVNATEASVNRAIDIQVATTVAILAAFSPERQLSVEEIRENVETHRHQIQAAIQQQFTLAFQYTYAGVTDAELTEYILFAESDYGRHYHAVIHRALDFAMTDCSQRCGSAIGDILKGVPLDQVRDEINRPLKRPLGDMYPQQK